MPFGDSSIQIRACTTVSCSSIRVAEPKSLHIRSFISEKLMRSQNPMWDIDTKQDREKINLVPSIVYFSFDIIVIDLTGCAWRKRSMTGRSPHGSMPCPTYRKKSPVNLHGTFLLPDQRTIVPFGRSLAIVTSERSASRSGSYPV